MAGTLRGVVHPQRSRLILSAWLALSTCFQKIMWPTNTFSFCNCEEAAQVPLGEIELRPGAPTSRGSRAPSMMQTEESL